MRKRSLGLTVFLAGVGILGLISSVFLRSSGLPQPGDKVSPRLVQEIEWTPGQQGPLWVELAATSESGKTRRLGFQASPKENPIALVRFYDSANDLIRPLEVELSQRC